MRLPVALLFAALLPGAAMAQAMLEAGTITGQVSTAARPDWAQGDDVPAVRFVKGAGIADGSWFRSIGSEPGAFSHLTGGSVPPPPAGTTYYVKKPDRPKSKTPGRVAGLVYEDGTKTPLRGVLVRML